MHVNGGRNRAMTLTKRHVCLSADYRVWLSEGKKYSLIGMVAVWMWSEEASSMCKNVIY